MKEEMLGQNINNYWNKDGLAIRLKRYWGRFKNEVLVFSRSLRLHESGCRKEDERLVER